MWVSEYMYCNLHGGLGLSRKGPIRNDVSRDKVSAQLHCVCNFGN
jgi:hypothetical protein